MAVREVTEPDGDRQDTTGHGADAPDWFTRALAVPADAGTVTVHDARIAFRAWGEPGPGIVLVHGGMANNHWWDHIAPQLTEGPWGAPRRVVAPDLSGHGDSAHRDAYDLREWSDEILAAAQAGGIVGRPVVVGHSMGGIVAYATSFHRPEDVAGIMAFDSPLRDATPEEREARRRLPARGGRTYPDVDSAVARFRLVPPQERAEPYIVDHIARSSLRPVEGGWRWKFDGTRIGKDRGTRLAGTHARCRAAYFRSEHGIVDDALFAHTRTILGPDAIVAVLPDAGHHPMLDRPLETVTAIRTALAAWDRDDARTTD